MGYGRLVPDRRAHLRAELDAYYARLYGLTRDELQYVLDPQEVYGSDFPRGETFCVLTKSPSFASSFPTLCVGDALGERTPVLCTGQGVGECR